MAAVLTIVGASIFLLLAVGHMALMMQSTPTSGPMTPTDPVVQAALERPGGIGMEPDLEETLFRAWTGFNHSHSLGIAVFAVVALANVIADYDAALDETWFVIFVLAVPTMYLGLSIRYWFSKPTSAIALGTVLIWAGVIAGLT